MSKKEYEIRYVNFKSDNWNYLMLELKNKIVIYINDKKKEGNK